MDKFIVLLDRTLKTLSHSRSSPPIDHYDSSIPLMRTNYAGEIAAQGLYLGAWTFSNHRHAHFYEHAMQEEYIHLDWCGQRIAELGGKVSILNPVWFSGAFCMGALSQIAGHRYALGFVQETERQVLKHLESHLDRLPKEDEVSREVVRKMIQDEKEHADEAKALGGIELPGSIIAIMSACGKILTNLSERY